eukprot:scaffold22807_cov98-Isochrysis_galbana.AAC.3
MTRTPPPPPSQHDNARQFPLRDPSQGCPGVRGQGVSSSQINSAPLFSVSVHGRLGSRSSS